ncbi:hypothetical protein C4559_02905 [Candidatus Microgenomates bacterium]|nr:MAG: hypothetical protein C4559_02905 [Candidatus Microgenomates bacterium]
MPDFRILTDILYISYLDFMRPCKTYPMHRSFLGPYLGEKIFLQDYKAIKQEVLKDVGPIPRREAATAEFIKEIMFDYRVSSYFFLKWIDSTFFPESILYPACGHDILPKLVFGTERIIHTSLEGSEEYFSRLGDGKKIIANNSALPFRDVCFKAVIICGVSTKSVSKWMKEFHRVLSKGGVVMIIKSMLDNLSVEEYCTSSFYSPFPIPPKFQKRGKSETEFYVFKKIKEK